MTDTATRTTDKPTRYAVYDETYLKYLPGVHETRAAADKAAKDHNGRTTVREV